MKNKEMKNLVWSIGEWNDDEFTPSNKVEDVFWAQEPDKYQPLSSNIPDGIYPFFSYHGLVGKLKITNKEVDMEYLDKQIPKMYPRTKDHVFVELMTMNPYGLVQIWMGS